MNMKNLIVSVLLLLPLGLAAQEMKIAVVNVQDVFNLLPELSDVEREMSTFAKQYQDAMKGMEDDYNRKFADLTAQNDSLTENIRMLRMQEIEGIRTRMENFAPMAREEIDKKQNELIAPLNEKIQKAIKEVSDENGYTYVLHPQTIIYSGSNAIDATDKVKAKLGLK
ncbi:MAG: OmpH family outer membrane protein [Tannerella sp.]|jgi:outer membrane protein|nr:OmpH family outer membrane protein [Tannerella sp.]